MRIIRGEKCPLLIGGRECGVIRGEEDTFEEDDGLLMFGEGAVLQDWSEVSRELSIEK